MDTNQGVSKGVNKIFRCEGDEFEQIPDLVMEQTGLRFPEAHQMADAIATLARALRLTRGDRFCRVPFCVTVEAEALGAKIKLGDNRFGPRVEAYAYTTLEDLRSLPEIDFTKGRVAEVLGSVEYLYGAGESVILNLEGPFTILASLMEPRVFYKAVRKERELVDAVIKRLEDSIFEYVVLGIQKGAEIISYGDPMGSMDVVGPKIYQEVVGIVTLSLLKRVEAHILKTGARVLVHLCGKTSISLENVGLCRMIIVDVSEGSNYGEALLEQLNKGAVKFIGNACIKKTLSSVHGNRIWGIEWLEANKQL